MIAWAGSLAGDNDRESFEDALSYAAADPELQRQAVQDQLATDAQAAAVIALPKSVLIDCKGFCGHVDAEGLALSQSSREQQRLVDDLLDRSGAETNDYGDVEDLVYDLDDAREAMLLTIIRGTESHVVC